MLTWHRELWLIDHGASLYFHHSWDNWEEQSRKPFVQVKEHVLLPWATELEAADQRSRMLLTPALIDHIISLIPADWLSHGSPILNADEARHVYRQFLNYRVATSEIFLKEAQHARKSLI